MSTKSYSPFDPQAVPVVSRDSHLPAVQSDLLSIEALRTRFTENKSWAVEVTDENRAHFLQKAQCRVGGEVLQHLPQF